MTLRLLQAQLDRRFGAVEKEIERLDSELEAIKSLKSDPATSTHRLAAVRDLPHSRFDRPFQQQRSRQPAENVAPVRNGRLVWNVGDHLRHKIATRRRLLARLRSLSGGYAALKADHASLA